MTVLTKTVWLRLQPSWARYYSTPRVEGFTVVAVTSKKPTRDGVSIQLKLEIPSEVFEPFVAAATLAIGQHDVVIKVDVEPPAQEEA